MTKIKKTPTSEQIVKSKLLNGKVTKATIPESPIIRKMQVKIFKTPLAPRVRKKLPEQDPLSVTPFLSKCTSTPLNGVFVTSSGRVVKPNMKYRELCPPSPLSPILADIGNFQQRRDVNVTRRKHSFESDKENKSSSSGENKSECNPGNVRRSPPATGQTEQRSPMKNLSLSSAFQPKIHIQSVASSMKIRSPKSVGKFNRRRSVGTRKIAMVNSDEEKHYRENNCSNLRVRLVRTPVKVVTSETHPTHQLRKTPASDSQNDNSLIKRLRDDWPSITLGEGSLLMPSIRRIPGDGRQRKMRLQLTPLIEMSTTSAASSTIVANKRKPCDEDYSSSEEFQGTDLREKENSFSAKKAPTWKDLSNKSIELPYDTPKRLSVPGKRGRTSKTSFTNAEVISSEVSEIIDSDETNGNVPMVNRNLKKIDRNEAEDKDRNRREDKQKATPSNLKKDPEENVSTKRTSSRHRRPTEKAKSANEAKRSRNKIDNDVDEDGKNKKVDNSNEKEGTQKSIAILSNPGKDVEEYVPRRKRGWPKRAESMNELRSINKSRNESVQHVNEHNKNKIVGESNEEEAKREANTNPSNVEKDAEENVSTRTSSRRRRPPEEEEEAKNANQLSSSVTGRIQSRSSPFESVPSKEASEEENGDPALKSKEIQLSTTQQNNNNSIVDLTVESPMEASKTLGTRKTLKLSLNSRGRSSTTSASVSNQKSNSQEGKQLEDSSRDVVAEKSKKNSLTTTTTDMSRKSVDADESIIPSFDLGSKSLLARSITDADGRFDRENQSKNIDSTVTKMPGSPLSISRNLANKFDSIEELLSSSKNDELNITTKSTTTSNLANCTNKFFHSRMAKTITEPTPTPALKSKKRSSRGKKQKEQIYDFLSQSSSSDVNDPAADVIQKLIQQGKVDVAKLKKGAGISVVKRKRRRRRKALAIESLEQKSILIGKEAMRKKKAVNTVRFNDDTHFGDDGVDLYEEEPNKGGFSELARSTMLNEAGKSNNTPQRTRITDRRSLLAMAQKIVGQSTPIRSPSQAPGSSVKLSPAPGSSSPWRVDDDKLPSLFYFSRNSDNLPSFSSDHIPSTPTKNKPKSLSSFSSNDSNMENIAPPSVREVDNENPASTARRGLSYRSPLKAISIIDVMHLPPLAMKNVIKDGQALEANKPAGDASSVCETSVVDADEGHLSTVDPSTVSNREYSKENNTASLFGFGDINDEDEGETRNRTLDPKRVSNREGLKENTNLFGFEEIIDDDEDNVTTNSNVVADRENLKKKLEGLRRLRPETPVASTSKAAHIKSVFDENRPKQKTLQQMFCSTMIERRSEQNDDHGDYFNDGYDINLSNLFKDPEPETTFDESISRRTYSRPFQRKRKLRNNFVMFMDSDASEDEEEAAQKEKKKSKKRQRKDNQDEKELNEFVNEFNEMCKEVSQYELQVE